MLSIKESLIYVYTVGCRSRFTVVSTQNTEFIPVLLFIVVLFLTWTTVNFLLLQTVYIAFLLRDMSVFLYRQLDKIDNYLFFSHVSNLRLHSYWYSQVKILIFKLFFLKTLKAIYNFHMVRNCLHQAKHSIEYKQLVLNTEETLERLSFHDFMSR